MLEAAEEIDDEIILNREIKKINLKKADSTELAESRLFNDEEIQLILKHIQRFGAIEDLLELQQIFDVDRIRQLEPYLFVNKEVKRKPQNWKLEISTSVSESINKATENNYSGDDLHFRTRIQLRPKIGIQSTLFFEKDAGEKWLPEKWFKGPDFTGFSLRFDPNRNTRFLLGDFLWNTGEGLVCGQGFQMGKSALVMNISGSHSGLRAKTSAEENKFFRGFAVEKSTKNFTGSLLISRHHRDAIIKNGEVQSLQTTGYHRTNSELEHNDALLLNEIGSGLSYHNRGVQVSWCGLLTQSDIPFHADPGNSTNLLLNSGISWQISLPGARTFGEAAVDQWKHTALISGWQFTPWKWFDLSVSFRRYSGNYSSVHGLAFSESRSVQNESGMYSGFRYYRKYWSFSGYADYYKNISPGEGEFGIQTGNDYLLQWDKKWKNGFNSTIRFRNEIKNSSNSFSRKSSLRFHLQYQINRQLTYRQRIEISRNATTQTSNGWLIYEDLKWKPVRGKWNFSCRWYSIRIEDFSTRIYTYENDIPMQYSFPALYAYPSRCYLLMNYSFNRAIQCWIKVESDFGKQSVGYQNSQLYIAGQNKWGWKFLIRYRI